EEQRNGYVLLLVILSIFLVGTLTVTSVLLIFCRRCYHGGKYCLSMASSHDQETERFLSTGTTGRRVSFNEAALFDHSKKAQEKGRRYTLTEGDFHHLKNARLTNLNIPSPALKIVTIHECDSAENTITMTTCPPAKSALSIFQTALTSLSPSGALPGDALNSMMAAGARGSSSSVTEGPHEGTSTPPLISGAGTQGPMLQFFTKLRRHASLEGASPYLKIKKWKLDSSQRASSLDTRGSPKRRQFQRQRAASESMDQDDSDTHHIDLIQYIARTRDTPYRPSQTSTRLLSPPSTPPPSLGSHEGPGVIGLSPDPQDEALSLEKRETPNSLDMADSQDPHTLYRDIWTLRATLEQYAASDQSSNNDRNSVCSDADSVCSLGGRTEAERGGLPKRGSDGETSTRKLLQMDSGYASIEAPCPSQPSFSPPALHRRDYSIDEKTDALFHEFLRHDPQFDLQDSPLKKHRSRIHLRKQWQRHKQWSDPGVRHFHSSFERQRTPLRRGESVNYPIDTSYHSTLEGTGNHDPPEHEETKQSSIPPEPPDEPSRLTDKLSIHLDERLYIGLRRTKDSAAAECVTVTATHTSPDHSPV
uniref:Uncharacterized protein n=1 Tax=Periophthalmus magnuspinnatus TaxID=409849 RepID=A0A3B4AMD7_9GOBI